MRRLLAFPLSMGHFARCAQGEERESSNEPASELDDNGAVRDVARNVRGGAGQDVNFVVGKIVLIQVRDLLNLRQLLGPSIGV